MGDPATSAALPFRLWAAFAVLPFADAFAAFVGFPLVWYIGGHSGRPHDPSQVAGAAAALTGFLSVLVTFAGAVPSVFWLRKRHRLSFGSLMWAGLILGNVPFAIYVVGLVLPFTVVHILVGTMDQHLVPVSALAAGALRAIAIGSVMGVGSASLFWLLGMCGASPRR
jgi:hypothetical protein